MTAYINARSLLAIAALCSCANLSAAPSAPMSAIRLTSVTSTVALDMPVGIVRSGQGCGESATRVWSELLARRMSAELTRAFDEELVKAGLSGKQPGTGTQLEVRAAIDGLKVNLCDLGGGAWKGGFDVAVSWELKRTGSGSSSLCVTTHGTAEHRTGSRARQTSTGLRQALAAAVRGLVADQSTQALLQLDESTGLPARTRDSGAAAQAATAQPAS